MTRDRTLGAIDLLAVPMRDVERTDPAGPASRSIVVELAAAHGQAMFGFVRRQGLTDMEAADAVQEVLLRLWSELARGTIVASPRGWAYRAIYRLAMDEHRLRRRMHGLRQRLTMGGREASRDPSDRIAVWSEVDRLPVRQRHVVYLRYRSDLSYEEIAAVLGVTASAARSHAAQAMATLRRRLQQEDRQP